jgi:NAD(P)-dependent dehydrogenase (short-subunit alcohol dehydrogenase family)
MPNPPSASSGAVLITGASSGIGRACASRLAAEGFRVFAGVRTPRDVDSLRLEARANLSPLLLDITNEEQLAACAALLRSELPEGRLAGLVNNAGISVTGPLEHVAIPALREQLEVNVVAQLAVTQAMLPLLRAGRGRIVNIGSTSGRIAGRYTGPYCASKFALEALTSTLRLELQSSGVAVSIVEPGVVSTPFWRKTLEAETKLAATLPPDGAERYGEALAHRREHMMSWGAGGSSPIAVCDAIVHALTAPRPRLRYIVGKDARIRTTLAALLPERLWYYLAASR